MPEHDPPIEPLHRLDPTEPEEEALGALQRIDPDPEDASEASTQPETSPTPRAARRPGDGVAAAIGLATLLSLSSIGAIGGLVAVSSGTLAPDASGAPVTQLETTAPLPIIRLEETDPVERKDRREPVEPAVEEPIATVAAVAEVPSDPGGNKERDEPGPAGRRSRRPAIGAWCDATPGTSCDATPTGTPGTIVETEGYVQTADEDDDHERPSRGRRAHG